MFIRNYSSTKLSKKERTQILHLDTLCTVCKCAQFANTGWAS